MYRKTKPHQQNANTMPVRGCYNKTLPTPHDRKVLMYSMHFVIVTVMFSF